MKKNWWSSLRIKIITWSFVPTVIILSAAAWFMFYSYQKVIGDLAIKQDWAIVQSRTPPLFQVFFEITNPIVVPIILQINTHREQPLEVRAQNIFDHAQGINVFDGGIYFLDQKGKVVKTHPEQPELLGQDWSDTPHFRFMTDHQGKAADPAKKNTGLFFFRGNPGEKFAIVNAGGAFVYVGAMHDSFPHALELSKMGFNAFALVYRPGAETAPEDLARAIAFVFEHADEFEVDTADYSLWGGAAARIHITTGLGKAIIDPGLSQIDKNTYQTPGFDQSANKVEITASTGAGNVSVDIRPQQ